MSAPVTVFAAVAAAAVVLTGLRNLFAAHPGADTAPALNARSPSRDRRFLARLFEVLFAARPAGAPPAVLCDIGGAGQITPASDPRGRIGTVIEVNDPASVSGAIPEAAFHALARTDLDVVTLFGVGMYLDEAHLARYFASVRGKLRPDGWLVVADPEYGSGLERSVRSMATAWLLATPIDYKPLEVVARIARRSGFELVQQQTHVGDWYVALFRPVPVPA
jgi:SAM-dependent methyltransferase